MVKEGIWVYPILRKYDVKNVQKFLFLLLWKNIYCLIWLEDSCLGAGTEKKIYNFYLKLSSKSWFGLVYLQDTIRSMFHALCYEYLSFFFFFFFPSSLLDMQQFYLVNLFSTQQTMSESHWGILPDAIYRLNLNSQRALFYPI